MKRKGKRIEPYTGHKNQAKEDKASGGHSNPQTHTKNLISSFSSSFSFLSPKLIHTNFQRRVDLMAAEGVDFVTNAHVGKNIDASKLKQDHDAILLAIGSTWPRDLSIPNRNVST